MIDAENAETLSVMDNFLFGREDDFDSLRPFPATVVRIDDTPFFRDPDLYDVDNFEAWEDSGDIDSADAAFMEGYLSD